jgi:hypothetical protein
MAWLIAAIVAARGPDAATSEAAAFRILISSCFAGRGIPRGYPLQDCHTKLATGAYARDFREAPGCSKRAAMPPSGSWVARYQIPGSKR